jgi:hypothetical protein
MTSTALLIMDVEQGIVDRFAREPGRVVAAQR